MRTIFLTAILLLFFKTNSQNLCANGSFETGSWDVETNLVNELLFKSSFGGQASIIDYFNITPGINDNQLVLIDLSVPSNYFGSQQPSNGNAYMGLWSYDVGDGTTGQRDAQIYSQLTTTMSTSETYVIDFKLSKMDFADAVPSFKVILSTSVTSGGNPSGHEKVIYHSQVTDIDNWQTIHLEVEKPEYNYNYVFIKCYKNAPLFAKRYLAGFYIDDVIVMNKCDFDGFGCYTTSGHFNPSFNNTISGNGSAFNVSNLSNATTARMKIEPMVPNQVYFDLTIHSCSGITNPFFWSGGLFVSGGITPAAAGQYQVSLELKNLCYKETFTTNIIKADGLFADDSQWFNYPSVCNLSDLLIAGCEPYIYLNRSFYSGEIKSFQASNTIRTANDIVVSADATLSLYAQNEIILSDGFEAIYGSDFQAIIKSPHGGGKSVDLWNNFSKVISDSLIQKDPQNISVYPNPTSDQLFIEFFEENEINLKITMVDNTGKMVQQIQDGVLNRGFHQFQVLTSNIQPGLYYIILQSDNEYFSTKIIVQ